MIIVVLLAGLVGSVVILGAFRGWVMTWLWLWFVVPLGLPSIGFWHAFGLVLLVSMFTGTAKPQHPKPEGEEALHLFGQTMVTSFIATAMALVLGFLVKGLVG